jgi:hypothetical protein
MHLANLFRGLSSYRSRALLDARGEAPVYFYVLPAIVWWLPLPLLLGFIAHLSLDFVYGGLVAAHDQRQSDGNYDKNRTRRRQSRFYNHLSQPVTSQTLTQRVHLQQLHVSW